MSTSCLERLMRGQLEGYRRLAHIIERQRNAIRTADGGALEITTREQDALVRMLASLDGQRARLLDHLLQRWMPAGQAPAVNPTLAHALAMAGDAVDDDRRTRMLCLGDELRAAIDSAKSGSAVIRTAAEALSRHVAGIQQTVHSALSRARVYGRRGHLALGSATPAAVDLKS